MQQALVILNSLLLGPWLYADVIPGWITFLSYACLYQSLWYLAMFSLTVDSVAHNLYGLEISTFGHSMTAVGVSSKSDIYLA